MGEFRLTSDMIGANNYEYYTPSFCDGHYCCRDCEKCPIADKILEFEAGEEEDDNLPSVPVQEQ